MASSLSTNRSPKPEGQFRRNDLTELLQSERRGLAPAPAATISDEGNEPAQLISPQATGRVATYVPSMVMPCSTITSSDRSSRSPSTSKLSV